MELFEINRTELTDQQVRDIRILLAEIFTPDKTPDTSSSALEAFRKNPHDAFDRHTMIYDSDRLVGHAEYFGREIKTESVAVTVLALAGVCIRPECRGRNLGAGLAKKAFAYVDNGTFMCSLFQTGVPKFYEKLDARLVSNTFINSNNTNDPAKNPWWDPFVMVYPASMNLGPGPIDLNGPGH